MSNSDQDEASAGLDEKYFVEIPFDITSNVLSRVPIATLMNFEFINHFWHSSMKKLIADSNFIDEHRAVSKSQSFVLIINEATRPEHLLSFQASGDKSVFESRRLRLIVISDLMKISGERGVGEIKCATEEIPVNRLPSSLVGDERPHWLEVCHTDGIVFLTKDWENLTLFSPAMNQFSTFRPKPNGTKKSNVLAVAFGSYESANEFKFKFVRILDSVKAEVFDPAISDAWRGIELTYTDIVLYSVFEPVNVKGQVFWLLQNPVGLVYFDVQQERIGTTFLPEDFPKDKSFHYNTTIVAQDDKLCLFFHDLRKSTIIWVMDDVVNVRTWRLWTEIDGSARPLVFKGSELLRKSINGDVVSYDFETRESNLVVGNEHLGNVLYIGLYFDNWSSIKWMIKFGRSSTLVEEEWSR